MCFANNIHTVRKTHSGYHESGIEKQLCLRWGQGARDYTEKNKYRLNLRQDFQAQLRRRSSAVLNVIAIGLTVAQRKHDSDSDVVPESYQIQDVLKPRNNYTRG